MHSGSTALFLIGIVAIGAAPIIFFLVWLAGSRRRAVPEDEGPRRISILPTALTTVAFLALVGAAFLLLYKPAAGSDPMAGMSMPATDHTASVLPHELAGLTATSIVTGDRALAEVTAMHPTSFSMTTAEVVQYAGPAGKAGVWVAFALDEASSAAMAKDMAAKIARGRSPFSTPVTVSGRPDVWKTTGLGQIHFFFARGTGIWWLAADEPLTDRALSDVLALAAGN